MDDWVTRAMQRWPNVPALFGWLALDRRGRWLIKGEPITHSRIVETINRNYGVDEHGRWYFQNGPQRGYIELAYAPFVLRRHRDGFITHTGLQVERPSQLVLDEEGTVSISTEHGLGEIAGADLDWVLERLLIDAQPIDEDALQTLLELPSGTETEAIISIGRTDVHVVRLDAIDAPQAFGFDRQPEPREGEKVGTRAPD
jgi:Protein of unknown function (DUF2946)